MRRELLQSCVSSRRTFSLLFAARTGHDSYTEKAVAHESLALANLNVKLEAVIRAGAPADMTATQVSPLLGAWLGLLETLDRFEAHGVPGPSKRALSETHITAAKTCHDLLAAQVSCSLGTTSHSGECLQTAATCLLHLLSYFLRCKIMPGAAESTWRL